MNIILRLILSTALIWNASGVCAQDLYFPPSGNNTWETILPQELGWCEEFIPPLLAFLEAGNTKAFIILKDGRIVVEEYFNNFSAQNNWYWASAGKVLTAFATGLAQQAELLDLSESVSDYLGPGWTSCNESDESAITIYHQLSMTSGLNEGLANSHCTDSECLHCLAVPGTRWAYHNAPYTLLSYVLEAATGQSINTLVNNAIKSPTGMDGLFVQVGYNRTFWSTPRSMARFGLLMQAGGNWNGTPVMANPGFYTQMITPSNTMNESYGYLWWLNGQNSFMLPGTQAVFPGKLFLQAPDDMFSALGLNGQILNVVPSEGLVMIRMGEEPQLPGPDFTLNDSIWTYLNLIMCPPTSVDQGSTKSFPQLYPNPVQGRLFLDPRPQNALYTVYSVTGKHVWTGDRPEDLAVDLLPAGIYLLVAEWEQHRKVYRFIR